MHFAFFGGIILDKIKKSIFILSIVLISLLSVGAVCAADAADDAVSAIDDVQIIESDNEIDEVIQEPVVADEPQAAEEEPAIAEDEPTGDETTKTFTQLIADIGDESSEVTLDGTYKFDSEVDTAYPVITRDLTINGPATIDGNGATRLFAVTSGTLTLKNLNLINGYADESTLDAGAILASGGNLDIQGCTFKDNKAYRLAGAIRVVANSYLKVTDSTFESCEAIGNQAGQGGAIQVANTATGLEVENCKFINCNTTNYGGAIDTALANSIINKCTFISNSVSSLWGGALSLRGADCVVSNSVFKENTAANGGSAIFILNVDSTVTNCIFDSNIVPSGPQYGYQGTVYLYKNGNDAMNPVISKCVFVNNSALKGSAIASSSNCVIENSIFLDNIATDEAFNLGPQATDIFIQNPDLVTAIVNNNWFGNTVDNYTASLQTFNETYWMWQGIANVQVDNWYFLDLAATAGAIDYDVLVSLNNLFTNSTGEITQVADCELPDWDVAITATAGQVNPATATLKNGIANVKYALYGDQITGTITADAAGPAVSKELVGIPTPHAAISLKENEDGTYEILVSLVDAEGNPISGEVSLDVNGVATPVTVTEGAASLPIEPNATVVLTDFDGSTQEIKVVVKEIVPTPVTKLDTVITISPASKPTYNKAIDAKSGYYIYATLKDAAGNILANKTVKAMSNGKVYTLTTDAKGQVKLLVAYAAKGNYNQAFTFLGDDQYNGAVAAVNLKVVAQKVKLTAPKKTYKAAAKTKKLTATLKNSKGKAIKGKKIVFTVNGKKYTAKTNAKGVATVKVKLSKKKTYKVTVQFAGDNTYKKLTKKTSVKIK